jgi:hypothetical protein
MADRCPLSYSSKNAYVNFSTNSNNGNDGKTVLIKNNSIVHARPISLAIVHTLHNSDRDTLKRCLFSQPTCRAWNTATASEAILVLAGLCLQYYSLGLSNSVSQLWPTANRPITILPAIDYLQFAAGITNVRWLRLLLRLKRI